MERKALMSVPFVSAETEPDSQHKMIGGCSTVQHYGQIYKKSPFDYFKNRNHFTCTLSHKYLVLC
jgi:hypothetical protein